jgi:hypothetical protein
MALRSAGLWDAGGTFYQGFTQRPLSIVVSARRGPYTLVVTISRWARVIPLALLATLSVDLADADCVKGSWVGAERCASVRDESPAEADPAGGCACCILSEAATAAMHAPVAAIQAPAPVLAPRRTCAGVLPVPYRPPLSLR